MKQLHTSYGNLQSWKLVIDSDSQTIRVSFSPARPILTSITIFIFCVAASIGVFLQINSPEASTISAIALIIGFFVSVGIMIWTRIEKGRGDLISYDFENDILSLPRINKVIESAKNRVSFSYEHYTDLSNHFFELNLVLDGNRTKFVSSSQKNGFQVILRSLERMGFNVSFIKLKC